MKFAALLGLLAVFGACSPLPPATRAWCESHFGSIAKAAIELGRFPEFMDAHTAWVSSRYEQDDAFYTAPAVAASCRIAYDRFVEGRPFVPGVDISTPPPGYPPG